MTQEKIEQIRENPKAFLLKGNKVRKFISSTQERIDSWRRLAESITVTLKPDGGSAPGGYKQSLVENAVCNITELENELIEEINKLTGIERDIQEVINGFVVDERYKIILELRYLNGYSWNAISEKLYYGKSRLHQLHGLALQEIRRSAEKNRRF